MNNDNYSVALADNLHRLMAYQNITNQHDLARKTGVSQRTISTLLDTANPSAINPRASTISKLAKYFRVPAWQLFIPNMPVELLVDGMMSKLVENYRDAPPQGRANVSRIAESEVRYAIATNRSDDEKAG